MRSKEKRENKDKWLGMREETWSGRGTRPKGETCRERGLKGRRKEGRKKRSRQWWWKIMNREWKIRKKKGEENNWDWKRGHEEGEEQDIREKHVSRKRIEDRRES